MLTARLTARVPSARDPRVVRLPGYEVRYRKRGRDGSAKCDLVPAAGGAAAGGAADGGPPAGGPAESGAAEGGALAGGPATAYGVVFTIDASDRRRLDRAEGAGAGYHAETLVVRCRDNDLDVFTYMADEAAVKPELLPFDWYRDLVVAGALEHGLPRDCVGRLRDVPVVEDPDVSRSDREKAVLERST